MKKVPSGNSNNASKKITKPIKAVFENYSDVDYLPNFKEWDNLIDQDEFQKLNAELFGNEHEE